MNPKSSVYAKRVIKAPIERVFKAWTDPEELQRWHAPEPEGIIAAQSENYIGGKRSLTFTYQKQVYYIAGTYKEFDPPHKLVYNWEDPEAPTNSVTTVLFKKIGDNETQLEVSHTNPTNGPVQLGLDMIMDNLQRHILR